MLLSEVKDNLLVMFKNPSCRNKKYKFKDIRRFACALNGWKIDLVRDALLELEEEGLIYVDSQGYYREFPYILGLVQGPIAINKHGEGYITDQDGNKLLIQPKDLGGALNGDIIIAKKTKKMSHGHVVAKTDKIIKRSTGMLIVEVHEKDGEMVLEPFSATLDGPVIINGMAMKPLVDGDRIMVKIGLKNEDKSYYAGFIKYIGHKDDPDADLKMIAIENNIAIDFSKEAMEEAHALPTEVLDEERVGRLDLTNEVIFSIDGAKTKDRDDAISIKINEKGNYVLGVHIADVSHYVKPGTKLWEEALQRSTSVYMVDTVIPMLPHILSNGICSLNPYVDRLTLSCVMELTPQGELVDFDFVDCVINSKKAMTYEDVNSILEDGVVPEDYEEYVDDLQLTKKIKNSIYDIDKITGRKVVWIEKNKTKDFWEQGILGSEYIAKALEYIAVKYVDELLDYDDLDKYVEVVNNHNSFLVENLIPTFISLAELRFILISLIREKVSIKDINFIFEKINDYAEDSVKTDLLKKLRLALSSQICKRHENPDGSISVFELSDKTFADIIENCEDGEDAVFKIDGVFAEKLAAKLVKLSKKLNIQSPKLIVPMDYRQIFFGLLSLYINDITVLAIEELDINAKVEILGEI